MDLPCPRQQRSLKVLHLVVQSFRRSYPSAGTDESRMYPVSVSKAYTIVACRVAKTFTITGIPCIGPRLPWSFRSMSRSDACLSRLLRGAMEIKALTAMPAVLCRPIWARYLPTRSTLVSRPESRKACMSATFVVRTSKLALPTQRCRDAIVEHRMNPFEAGMGLTLNGGLVGIYE
jgi:hypothetical protein